MKEIILNAINEVLEGKGDSKILEVSSDTNLRLDLGFDSFDLAELTVRIEESTGKDIFENGIINTIGDISEILNS